MMVRRLSVSRVSSLILVMILVLATFVAAPVSVSALNFADRSLKIESPLPSANTEHRFDFDFMTASSVGSVVFEYCDDPLFIVACVAPAGLNVGGASLDSQSGEVGFSIMSSSVNGIVLTRAAAAVTPQPSDYEFSNIINPNANNQTFFVRISSHASADGTGSIIDLGSVAASTDEGILVTAEVPPYLLFCVARQVTTGCSSATGFFLDFGELSPVTTKTATSEMGAESNAISGYAITVSGTTLTAGNIVIPALTTRSSSQVGSSQFGMNLRGNNTPSVGIEPVGSAIGSAVGDYSFQNQFTFRNGDIVAASSGPSLFTEFQASYIANVSEAQLPGRYATTLTFICTATY